MPEKKRKGKGRNKKNKEGGKQEEEAGPKEGTFHLQHILNIANKRALAGRPRSISFRNILVAKNFFLLLKDNKNKSQQESKQDVF